MPENREIGIDREWKRQIEQKKDRDQKRRKIEK